MELPEEGGIEPDYCFYIDNWQAVVGRDRLEWGTDPSPDLVIEIDVTTYTDANDYALHRVPEVWLLKRNQLAIYGLQDSEYQLQATSRYFPDVDLQAIVAECLEAAKERGTGVAIRELRQRL
jgi:Uma2 family endonuclease